MTQPRGRATIERRVYLYSAVLRHPEKDEKSGLYEEAQVDVTNVMNAIDNLPKDLERAVNGEHTNFLLDNLPTRFTSYMSLNIDYTTDDFVMGRFGLTRFYGIPQAEGGGTVSNMPLRDDQGVYDPCHFVYCFT